MQIKNFQAPTIQKALDQVRREFGANAVILKTDILSDKGLKSFSVTAARDYQEETQKQSSPPRTGTALKQNFRAAHRQARPLMMETLLLDLLLPKLLDDASRSCYLALREHDVEVEVATTLCQKLTAAKGTVREELPMLLKALAAGSADLPSDLKQVFLVGPPGSGKSSVLAKMAAQLVFVNGRTVKLSTLDNFRPTAEAEIENLAEILGFVDESREPAETQSGQEILLIDTEGLIPGDDEGIDRLHKAIAKMKNSFTVLVLSATASWCNNRAYLEHFESLAIDAVVVTGLDLSNGCGTVINIMAGHYPPVLGVCDSRMPTGMIDPFDPEKHLDKLIGGLDV